MRTLFSPCPAATAACLSLVFLATGCNERTFRMPTRNMTPSINAGDEVVVDFAAFDDNLPQRWHIVAYKSPALASGSPAEHIWVMRVYGLPGESISVDGDHIVVNGAIPQLPVSLKQSGFEPRVRFGHEELMHPHPIQLAADEYYLIGDNPDLANDSRFTGPVPFARIVGKVNTGQ